MSYLTKKEFESSIDELYPRLHRAMTAYLYGTSLEPDDILQETFLKAIRNLHTFQGGASLYTWMYSIARNICIDQFRKLKHEKKRDFASVEELPITAEEKNNTEEINLLRKAIMSLPDDLRELVIMKAIDEMGYRQISDITGVNEQTLKSRMLKARKLLSIELKKMGVRS